jgi:thiamine-phosphate pyrophosphorylase
MLRYAISDGRSPQGGFSEWLERCLSAGVELIQIREKRLGARELYELCVEARARPNPHGSRLLVNSRTDVALAAGLDGVHLSADSIAPSQLRKISPAGFRIGVSTHSIDEARRAAGESADFVVFGPVFDPISKPSQGPSKGLEGLRAVCSAVSIPVLALGGMTFENARACVEAGAAGIAGITLFGPRV